MGKKTGGKERWQNRGGNSNRDPNAMDIGSMSIEERTQLMKRGACFKCKKIGHLSKDCPNRAKPKKEETAWKPSPKDLKAHIRGMDLKAREEFLQLMVTEEDF